MSRLADQSFHLAHRFAQTDKHRATDDRVTDVQLPYTGERRDRLHIEVVERMAGVEAKPVSKYRRARRANSFELGYDGSALRIAAAGVKGMRIRTGMDLAHAGADERGGFDLAHVGIDEDAGDDARRRELADDLAKPPDLTGHVEPPFGGDLLAPLRHEHRHLGFQVAGDAHHL